jgi:hypothetical protein
MPTQRTTSHECIFSPQLFDVINGSEQAFGYFRLKGA